MTTLIISERNKKNIAKIPHEIKGVLTIKTISDASELLNIVFIKKK
ncbi:S16 family serine protease [Candidatus Tisiphia endosymbiont of Sialis lutaria]